MVMPLWDENPFTKLSKPWATWGIIALNIFVFALQAAYGDSEEAILRAYALTPVALSHPVSLLGGLPADLTLVTSMLLHADIFHLFGNMIFLLVFGDDVVEGPGRAVRGLDPQRLRPDDRHEAAHAQRLGERLAAAQQAVHGGVRKRTVRAGTGGGLKAAAGRRSGRPR